MPAKFLVRLDDACPTMNLAMWLSLEGAMDGLEIKPIVGVIPDCQDPELAYNPPDPNFWDVVRRWREKGWEIALHGLNHRYHPVPAGSFSFVPLNQKSEFIGRALEDQKEMIAKGMAIFVREGIHSDMFMAPSHAFDRNTLEALRSETNVRWITDGISYRVFSREGFNWIPQQLWRFRPMISGVWTVCVHPNAMTALQIERLISDLIKYRKSIVEPRQVMQEGPERSLSDALMEAAFWSAMRLRRILKRSPASLGE